VQLAEMGIEPIRSFDQGILSPQPNEDYPVKNKGDTKNGKIDCVFYLCFFLQKYPELAQVIEAWPGLDEAVRTQIMDLLKRAGKP